MINVLGLLSLSLIPGAQASDCPAPVGAAAWSATLDSAEQAFIDLDKEALLAALATTVEDLPCLSEKLSPETAAQFHRVQAFGSWLGGDQDTAVLHFGSASAASGGAPLPEGLVPTGHPMQERYEAVRGATWVMQELEQPGEGLLLIDGAITLALPVERPVVVQYQSVDGAVLWTSLHDKNAALPDYPLAVGGPTPASPAGTEPTASRAPRGLLGAALAGAVASGAMLAGSVYTSGLYWDSTSVAMAEDRKGLTNGLIAGSAAGFGLTVGLGAVAVVKWKF